MARHRTVSPRRPSDDRQPAPGTAMQIDTLTVLRCPYCGGRLELVSSIRHRSSDTEIDEGVLGCHCCVFAVVAGIPVLHLQPSAIRAREHIEAGRSSLALQEMVGFNTGSDEGGDASRFEAAAASETSTYRD